MNQSELDDFKDERFAYEAVQLRRWDDLAKDPNMSTPSIEDFMPLLDSLLPQHS
jgi:predicted HD phosphohydrolase